MPETSPATHLANLCETTSLALARVHADRQAFASKALGPVQAQAARLTLAESERLAVFELGRLAEAASSSWPHLADVAQKQARTMAEPGAWAARWLETAVVVESGVAA